MSENKIREFNYIFPAAFHGVVVCELVNVYYGLVVLVETLFFMRLHLAMWLVFVVDMLMTKTYIQKTICKVKNCICICLCNCVLFTKLKHFRMGNKNKEQIVRFQIVYILFLWLNLWLQITPKASPRQSFGDPSSIHKHTLS